MAWHGMAWHGVAWHGMAWLAMVSMKNPGRSSAAGGEPGEDVTRGAPLGAKSRTPVDYFSTQPVGK